jgi:alcohol dehydrogenase
MPAHGFPAMLAEILDGTLQPQRLVTRRVGLRDAPAALAQVGEHPGAGVALVLP